jgi:hypothetical protein
MRNFKIKVNSEESEIVQKLLFLAGSCWAGTINTKDVQHTDKYLFHTSGIITYSDYYDPGYFNRHKFNEITFKKFIEEIDMELAEKRRK